MNRRPSFGSAMFVSAIPLLRREHGLAHATSRMKPHQPSHGSIGFPAYQAVRHIAVPKSLQFAMSTWKPLWIKGANDWRGSAPASSGSGAMRSFSHRDVSCLDWNANCRTSNPIPQTYGTRHKAGDKKLHYSLPAGWFLHAVGEAKGCDKTVAEWFEGRPQFTPDKVAAWNELAPNIGKEGFPVRRGFLWVLKTYYGGSPPDPRVDSAFTAIAYDEGFLDEVQPLPR